MIHSISGTLALARSDFFGVSLGGMTLKIRTSSNVLKSLPQTGTSVNVYTYLHVREDVLDLYGFLEEGDLEFFQLLISVSGIGPKSALGIMGVERVENLKAAIGEGKAELLTKAAGVGRKTAERIILELRGKIAQIGSGAIAGLMESDGDIIEALSNLGYAKAQAREALGKVGAGVTGTEARVREALKILRQ